MTRKQLIEDIKEKFGTIANFCRKANLDYDEIKNFLMRPKPGDTDTPKAQARVKEIVKIMNKTKNPSGLGEKIKPEDTAFIFLRVTEIAGDVKTFCERYPKWNYDFVNHIVAGNGRIVTKSKKVIKFMKFLESVKT